MGVTASDVSSRVTRNKCRCLKVWEEEGVQPKCENYCCNPDADPSGEWCFVEDFKCEDSDWGYCLPAISEQKDVTETTTCLDKPGWTDEEKDDCQVYSTNVWCTKSNEVGSGWHEEWGDIDEFKSDGASALQACCACGGGSVPIKEVQGKTSKILIVSIGLSLLLACFLGVTSLYWRSNYNKIAYASVGAKTIGRQEVHATADEI